MVKLTKKDVAVLALAKLGGAEEIVDTEDAAIAAHAIDPKAFGWKKYVDRVDLDLVRMTLRHEGEARDPRIEGSIQHGWHLTPSGVAWLESNSALLNAAGISVAALSAATQRWRAETREVGAATNRVRTSVAFRMWSEGQTFTSRQAAEVFRIDEYTPAKDRTHKTARLRELAKHDEEIERFMQIAIPLALQLAAPTGRQNKENVDE